MNKQVHTKLEGGPGNSLTELVVLLLLFSDFEESFLVPSFERFLEGPPFEH